MIVKPMLPAYGGYTLARDDGKVILIKGAIPGETVAVEVREKKRDYTLATVTQVVESSEFRVEPKCPVFGICGGCQLQYIAYERQLKLKEEVLLDSLGRLGGIEVVTGPLLADRQWNYRHRAQFKVGREGTIGFFRESSRDVVDVESCPLMTDGINELLGMIRDQRLGQGLRELHLTCADAPAVLLRTDDPGLCVSQSYRDIGIPTIACNDVLLDGPGSVTFDLAGLRYSVSPWTFIQAHWALNHRVVEAIMQETGPLAGKTVLDLYAGAGNFSLPLARAAEEVLLVEENPHAVEDGMRNLKLNRLKNCRFVKSTAEKYKFQRKADLLLLDPPRPGLTADVAKKVLELAPQQVVYISCNPATLARDLKKFKTAYDITSVRMIDFFPNTFHIEAAVFLHLR